MAKNRPYVLSVAGFDPSAGAGILADIKTLESIKTYGLSVCTANTIQHESVWTGVRWMDMDSIRQQLDLLLSQYNIWVVKIGIVKNWSMLLSIINQLKSHDENIQILWDPILKSSSGFTFHTPEEYRGQLELILEKITLVLPNYEELQQFYPNKSIGDAIEIISSHTNLFVKGGHRTTAIGRDQLFTKAGKVFSLNPKAILCHPKHGSGCVLSSAIAAYLARGFKLPKACYRAKRYTERFLESNKTLLGYHRM